MALNRRRIGAKLLTEQDTIGTVNNSAAMGTVTNHPTADQTLENFGKVCTAAVQIRNQTRDIAGMNGKTQVNETEIQ